MNTENQHQSHDDLIVAEPSDGTLAPATASVITNEAPTGGRPDSAHHDPFSEPIVEETKEEMKDQIDTKVVNSK